MSTVTMYSLYYVMTISFIGFTPIITGTTTCTECQCSTSILTITVSSISLVVLVIAGIIIIILVLIVIRQQKKIQLLRYGYVIRYKLTLLTRCSMKTSHEDIAMTTSPAYSIVKTSTK